MQNRLFRISSAFLLLTGATFYLSAQPQGDFVYVMTNQPSGNTVIQYRRTDVGSLTKIAEVATQGLGGTGNGAGALDPLGSQDALVMSDDGTTLLAVNAGSNEITALTTGANGPVFSSKVPSGGDFPNSVATHGNVVYVLNAHSYNIVGFRLTGGMLQAIPGAVAPIPDGFAGKGHDIRFSPDGNSVIVSVEGTNVFNVFTLDSQGVVTGVVTSTASGWAPFGFKFTPGGVLVSTEAISSSVSSYQLTDQDLLNVISPRVANGQAATCWISISPDGRFAFVSNTGSGTITTYQIGGDGSLVLDQIVAASLDSGGAPIDMGVSIDGRFLYVIDSGLGRIVSYSVNGSSLQSLGSVTGLPQTLQGIVVR